MNFSPYASPQNEPSSRVAFSGNRIDRLSETRADDAAAKALADYRARLLILAEGRIFLTLHDGVFDPYHTVAEAQELQAHLNDAILLGHDENGPILAAASGFSPEDLPVNIKAIDYRSVYMQGLIDAEALGALAQGAALLSWHANHRFCGRCGTQTDMRAGGYKRVCPACTREHFPRTDPVVIMLVLSGERCLLGRSPHFAPGMVSCLAGFVEPGETIEAAVRRETLEEAGIHTGPVSYHASQPWPFPYSLMIGCYAQAASEDIQLDLNELEECRWFSRAQVRRMLDGNHEDGFTVPPGGAIANILIRDWAQAGD